MEFSINGKTPIAGWFICWKILWNGWFEDLDTIILGNLHVCICHSFVDLFGKQPNIPSCLLVLMSHVDGTGHDMLWYPFLGRSQTKTYIKRCWNDTDLYMYDIFGDLSSLCCRWLPAWKHLRIFSNPICHHNFGYRSLYLVMILPLPVEHDFSSVKRNIFPFGCFNQPFLSRRLGSTFFNRWFLTRKRLENGWERMNMCFFFFSCHFSWLPTPPRSRLLSFGTKPPGEASNSTHAVWLWSQENSMATS